MAVCVNIFVWDAQTGTVKLACKAFKTCFCYESPLFLQSWDGKQLLRRPVLKLDNILYMVPVKSNMKLWQNRNWEMQNTRTTPLEMLKRWPYKPNWPHNINLFYCHILLKYDPALGDALNRLFPTDCYAVLRFSNYVFLKMVNCTTIWYIELLHFPFERR